MELKIYEGEKKKKEDIVRLKLKKIGDYIDLVMVDENGEELLGSCILKISSKGLYRYDIGIKLDEDDKIKEGD